MKEFDEQWQIIAEQMYDAPMFWCEAGWKAALKWVKGEIDRTHSGNDVIDWIFEDELEK